MITFPKTTRSSPKELLKFTLLIAFSPVQPISANVSGNIEARIQEIVDEEIANSATPGASVSVVADGRVVRHAH